MRRSSSTSPDVEETEFTRKSETHPPDAFSSSNLPPCGEDEEGGVNTDELVFSSLDTHFSFSVFFEQFFFHILFPLSIVYSFSRYGTTHAHIQGYHYSQRPSYPTTYMPFICSVLAVWCIMKDPGQLDYGMIVMPFGVFVLQRMMVAVKYATLSPDEYKAFLSIGRPAPLFAQLSAVARAKASLHMRNMQIVSGWLVVPDELVKHELVVSSLTQGIHLSSLFFYIPVGPDSLTRESNPEKMLADWQRLHKDLNSRNTLQRQRSSSQPGRMNSSSSSNNWRLTNDKKYMKVPCQEVCEYMFFVLNKTVDSYMGYMLLLLFFVDVCVLSNYIYSYRNVLGHSLYTVIFFASTSYLLVFFFPVLFAFCLAALADIYRRYEISRMLEELINVSDVSMVDTSLYGKSRGSKRRQKEAVQLQTCTQNLQSGSALKSFGTASLPRIDMSMPANHVSWCMCRRILTGVGRRFLNRTDLYMGLLALLCLVMVSNSVRAMFFSTDSRHEVCSSYSFTQSLLTLSMVAFVLFLLMTGIVMTNRHMSWHRVQISMHLLHANRAMHMLLFGDSVGHVKGTGSNLGMSHRGHTLGKPARRTLLKDRSCVSDSMKSLTSVQEKEEAIDFLQECIESANAVMQTVIEVDDVQPLKLLNLHVEKEYVISLVSSAVIYGIVLYSYCQGVSSI